jgi:hypothetical protein
MADKKHFIHVYESEGEFRVHPPVLVVDGAGPRDDVQLVNHTTDDAVWYVGAAILDANPVATNVAKGGGKSGFKKVHSQTAGNAKLATYQVFMIQSGKKAKGNSDPVIIIEN